MAEYFLPCKITVYESDGKTKFGLPKTTVLVNMLEVLNSRKLLNRLREP
ncbi:MULTISPECIES: DUF302 domain-containing protein [Bacillales]|nr:DUF302 domain-containing protein [Brevibacillus agri]MDN4094604.1 DUF302 domain-containing protein [Brevibacillus agri]MED3501938.1 DUF302 domain-containing protein [Brevibacillus agri]